MTVSKPIADPQHDPIPTIIAGPILRRVDKSRVVVWLVTSIDVDLALKVQPAVKETSQPVETLDGKCEQQSFCVGTRAFVQMLTLSADSLLEEANRYHYWVSEKGQDSDLIDDDYYYPDSTRCSFTFTTQLKNVAHGSCRKPHFCGDDALSQLDVQIEQASADSLPDLLIMSGDQIYADDVAGPTLNAIRQVIALLGLHEEDLDDATLSHSSELTESPLGYYKREQILPKTEDNSVLASLFFGAKRKPIFTSVNAKNHLIAFNEIMAMYILVWSPVMWRYVDLTRPKHLEDTFFDLYQRELESIEGFVLSLPKTARMLAHVPTYMIFDDHDVTDDWNLTRAWEEAVYSHPLSKRMIGNALMGYWLCQGLPNAPEKFKPLIEQAATVFQPQALQEQDAFIEQLYDWNQWHYSLDTCPPVYVMDTRTQRWRSESNPNKPSGLLDWEALCEFQQEILGQPSVIVVSAAPIYGLKFIEAVQKVFTFFGQALMVDAENWMAHKGTAEVILNIFRHYKTPPLFMILSGDVHYSFVYDVTLRFRRNSPRILQFTCSGFKNAFPPGLLKTFERFNRVLYSKRSPLNWFTRRRNMRIDERDPEPDLDDCVLGHVVNAPSVGLLHLNDEGQPTQCKLLLANGKTVTFTQD